MTGGAGHHSYLHLGSRPERQAHIFATFRVESVLPLTQAAQVIAAESSIGTWTDVGTMTVEKDAFRRLSARVIAVRHRTKTVRIAYPLALFEAGNIPQLLSSVAGNIFSMKAVSHLRLEDLEFPKRYLAACPGPAYGLAGIRRLTGISRRPLIGCIMKPKMGLTWREHAQFAYRAFIAGVDLVKDDENLTDQAFNPFDQRARAMITLAKKAERLTGQKKICALNVTAPTEVMIQRARLIKRLGGTCAMVDIVTAGFSGLQALRNARLGLIIHGHRAMHAAFSRDPRQGISMLVLAKLARLAGVDQLHVGTIVGKMEGAAPEVLELYRQVRASWGKIKPVLPIASGGLHPGLVPALMRYTGQDVIINFGGGIHGHPGGTTAGAAAANQAVSAAVSGVPIREYAQTHPELAVALRHWGTRSS